MKLLLKNDKYLMRIKRVVIVFLAINTCFWCVLTDIAFSSAETPLAVIISVEGTVNLRRKNKTHLAKEEIELYEGDVITTDRLSRVTLLYLGEELIHIPEEKTLRMSTDELSVPEQGKLAKLKYVLSAAYTGMKSSLFPQPALSSPGAARKWLHLLEAEIIDLLMPVATKVITPYPRFTWRPLQGIKKYEVIISDGSGQVIWRHETTRTEFDYPQKAPALIPGEYYFWQVKGGDANYRESDPRENLYLTFGLAYFVVMYDEDIQDVKKSVEEAKQVIGSDQDEIFNLLLGMYYEKNQLYGEAQEEYQKLMTRKPANDIYRKMLANLYVKIGRKWAATELLQE